MPLTGTLRTWNEDRGFGFIAPANGGREIFVHISEFPRDGSRPVKGEVLTFELGRGKDGRPQAVRVFRQAFSQPSSHPPSRAKQSHRRLSPLAIVSVLVALLVVGAYGYSTLSTRLPALAPPAVAPTDADPASSAQFRCDGRQYCSQMTSCAEAEFFLSNCPGVKMDGNNDGVPCEKQWCGTPFSR